MVSCATSGLRLLSVCAALLLSAVAGDEECPAGGRCESGGDYYWPQQKGDLGRTGLSPYVVPSKLEAGPTWSFHDDTEDVARATPLIDDKMNIYHSTIAGRVYKFSSSGELLWKHWLNCTLPAVGALHVGSWYLLSADGEVMALSMETGGVLWRRKFAVSTGSDTSSVLAYNGTIVFATLLPWNFNRHVGNNKVVAVSAGDGSVRWTFCPDAQVYNFQASTPGDGTIVFQDKVGGVYRLALEDGTVVWRSGMVERTSRMSTGAAVVANGRVFVVSNVGYTENPGKFYGVLHTYRLTDGQLLWYQVLPYQANQAVAHGPIKGSVDRDSVVVGIGENPGVVAGFWMPWLGQVASAILNRLSLAFPRWYSRATPSAMFAFDAETGEQRWRLQLEDFHQPACAGDAERLEVRYLLVTNGTSPHNDPICLPDSCSQPTLGADGVVYQAWQDGKVHAVGDADGDGKISASEVSSYKFSDAFQASMAMAPGLLALAPCGGGLHVWRS